MYLFKMNDKKSLFLDYPELKDIKEFSNLTAEHFDFVWYYSNPTSEISIVNEYDKVKVCLEKSGLKLTKNETENYLDLKFPLEIKEAMDRMSTLNPDARKRGKLITQKIFDSLEQMIDEGLSKSADIDEKKKFIELSMEIAQNLPTVIRQLERGFGITEKEEKKEVSLIKKKKVIQKDISEMEEHIDNIGK